MFSFSDLFGPTLNPLCGTHYEWQGKTYFLLHDLPSFVGMFLAIEVEGPHDRGAFGKPVTIVPHKPTIVAVRAKEASETRHRQQYEFRHTLIGTRFGEVRGVWRDVVAEDCTEQCPGHRGFRSEGIAPEHDAYVQSMCDVHRPLAEAYAAEHPEVWPPAP